ncbi:MAG: UvrD-helicase domain-containing protein, partial [Bacteroidales bacterium]
MEVLYHKDINYNPVKKQFAKTVDYLQNENFSAAEVKKVHGNGYYRAKLDYRNRLLFTLGHYNNKYYILLLEIIFNHEYHKSRFLKGADIDESRFETLDHPNDINNHGIHPLTYVNPETPYFHVLDKIMSFDRDQNYLFSLPTPFIVIGPAGSGKTALTLEKMKTLKGSVLYTTLSSYLTENSANLFYANNYDNDKLNIDFLSYREFLETLHIIEGKEADFRVFNSWFNRHRQKTSIRNAQKLYEEFKGVITGYNIDKPYMSEEEYLNLGVKQSIFIEEERKQAYELFKKYLQFLKENGYYDINTISHQWLPLCKPRYDFIVVDEVQDFTNIQLYLILQALKKPTQFILCGDSNQIVHPNLFSWSNVKSMFYLNEIKGNNINILKTNYRNSTSVTSTANALLKIKNARFGSIDKESTYLISSVSKDQGKVNFLKDAPEIKNELNRKTHKSTNYAVLVMRHEDKPTARKYFQTPLVFSIQEAKGLEYDNIIMLNFVSENSKVFREIIKGVGKEDVENDELTFSRAKDKKDKSLETYKFYINSFYVGITRAVKNIHLIESDAKHPFFELIGLIESKKQLHIQQESSSDEDWQKEANKLEKQGKNEQAEEIRKHILGNQKPDWEPITPQNIEELKEKALDPDNFNKKAKDKLFHYALLYNETELIDKLVELTYKRANDPEKERGALFRKYYYHYKQDNIQALANEIKKYGLNYRDQFNLTPLLAATLSGSVKIINFLNDLGVDQTLVDNQGKNAVQLALKLAYLQENYRKRVLSEIYPLIVTENIKLKVNDQLVKLDNHKIEYFLVNFFIAILPEILKKQKHHFYYSGITLNDYIDILEEFPENVLFDYRKKRSYLNANLAKNEIDRNDPYNKKLFLRMERGYYVLNPEMEIYINNRWMNIYDAMNIEKIRKLTNEEIREKLWEQLPESVRAEMSENLKKFSNDSEADGDEEEEEPDGPSQEESDSSDNKKDNGQDERQLSLDL